MASAKVDTATLAREMVREIKSGVFKPVYLLMGDEPFYPEMVCDAVINNCVDPSARDFNQIVLYGPDADTDKIISSLRQFPMMSERLLVVVRDAQLFKGVEGLSVYLDNPLETSVLVLLFRGASLDKRTVLYKTASKIGCVLDSPSLRDYEMPRWITDYYRSRSLDITADAANLLYEAAGTSLSTIVHETDKLIKSLPEGKTSISAEDIENNVGISRQFSVFELTKALSSRDGAKALYLGTQIGNAARFQLVTVMSNLYTHFYRILKYSLLLSSNPNPTDAQKADALSGVSPFFYREYDIAVRRYSRNSLMSIMSLLCEFDYRSKGGDGETVEQGSLLVELISKILAA